MAVEKETQIVSKKIAGSDLVKFKPVFSHDSKYLFVTCEETVKVFSTSSGELVRELRNHKNEVICTFLNPKNQLQLITCTSDKIRFWDYLDGICYQILAVDKNIKKIIWPSSQSSAYILTDTNALYETYDLRRPSKQWQFVQRKFSENMVDGLSGTYLAAFKRNELYVYFTSTRKMLNHRMVAPQRFTCIATHPSEYCFATGDYNGRIHVWYNFLKGSFVRSTMHWHQLPLADLTFTAAGSRIISGGGECVLVNWMIETDYRDYVPRLGMPMVYVTSSPNNTIIATSHVDNAIRLLNNQGDVMHTIQGLTKGHLWKEFGWDPVPTGLLYDSQNQALVMNGRPGHLQFFKHSEDKQLFNLDITKTNFHHSEREFKVFPIEVEKAAFDATGNWLATVERRTDGVSVSDFRLKFWSYSAKSSNYNLNTRVEFPHNGKIIGLKFQPLLKKSKESILLVTSSPEDKRFKLWKLVDDSDIYRDKVAWSCESVGYYRDMPCTQLAFSEDGSVLGIAFNHIVSLWDAENCDLNATLCHPRITDDISHLEFGIKDCATLIVCATKTSLNIWDVVSLTVKWCVDINVACLAKDCFSTMMAVFNNTGDLVVFEPSSPKAVFMQRKVSKKCVIHAAFIPNNAKPADKQLPWQQHSTLCFLNEDQLLFEVADSLEADQESVQPLSVQLQSNVPLTPFGMLLAKERKSGVQEKEITYQKPRATSEVLREMFTSPSNTLPPVSVLFDLHLSCCIRKEDAKTEDELILDEMAAAEQSRNQMEVDSDSDDDDDEQVQVKTVKESDQNQSLEESIVPSQLLEEEKALEKVLRESFKWLKV